MAQYEEIPSKFAPSDVSLNCTGIQTKHVSKVILREKVVLFASDPGIGTHFIEAYGNTIEKYDGFHLMQYPVPNTHVTVDLFIYNVTSSIFKNRTHLKNHVQNASFFVYLLDQHDSLQSVLERLSVVNDVRIRNGFEDEPIVTLVGNSNLVRISNLFLKRIHFDNKYAPSH